MKKNQELLSAVAKTVFRVNGQLLAIGEELARPVGLTAASWLVIGAAFSGPKPVAQIAREIGVTRQSVQRTADLLVERKLAQYDPNPAHRRAKLLAPTADGLEAVRRISPAHAAFADRLAHELSVEELSDIVTTLTALSAALDHLGSPVGSRAA
jgi:DNA-binding MarR family transcriptional regulator